jgi:hypothetical protein
MLAATPPPASPPTRAAPGPVPGRRHQPRHPALGRRRGDAGPGAATVRHGRPRAQPLVGLDVRGGGGGLQRHRERQQPLRPRRRLPHQRRLPRRRRLRRGHRPRQPEGPRAPGSRQRRGLPDGPPPRSPPPAARARPSSR